MRVLVVAALVMVCLAFALLLERRRTEEVPVPAPRVEEPALDAGNAQLESYPAENAPDASIQPPPIGAPKPVTPASPILPGTIESVDSLPPGHPHRSIFDAVFKKGQDAADACRDRFEIPRVQELLPQSIVIGERGSPGSTLQEISMRQVIAFDVSVTKDGLRVEDVRVTKTILEFPAPDGTLRRALIADGYLNRCVERAMLQAVVASSSGPALERFWIEGIAGEAVYDLR